jgi:hypothetical protein
MHERRGFSWAFYTLVALAIFAPLLAPGYILTLDLSWGPHIGAASVKDNGWALHELIFGLSRVLPSQVVEKLVLLIIFVLAGVGAHRLASRRYPAWPAVAAGMVFVVNPFTYERLLAGQWLVLGGYALLPWFVDALVVMLSRPGLRRALALAGWSAAIGAVSLHAVGMAVLLAVIVALATGWGRFGVWHKSVGWGAFTLGMAGAAGSLWLIPLLLRRSPTAGVIASFNADQFKAFATSGGTLGLPLNVITLQGFWGDGRGLVAPADGTGGWFYIALGLLLAAVCFGAVIGGRRRDRLAIALSITAVIAWILALGVAYAPLAGVTSFLVAHLAFYRGYREPEKWVGIMALSYSYLLAVTVAYIRDNCAGYWRRALTTGAVLLPVIWVPLMFWGAAGQLIATDYPASWYQLNSRLNALPPAPPGHPDTLILPWHQYIYVNFARRTVANPAPNFFDRPTIVSNDPELPGLTPESQTDLAARIQNNVINRRFFEQNAGSELSRLGVHYVVLLKVSDWSDYGWLSTQSDLTLVAETPEWLLLTAPAHP